MALTIICGKHDINACVAVAYSYDPGDVVLTGVPGAPITITMDAIGTDGIGGVYPNGDSGSPYMYMGSQSISGLSPFPVKHAYTADQASTGDQVSGELNASPGDNDDFSHFFISCDNVQFENAISCEAGAYTHIKADVEDPSLPVAAGMWCCEDMCYADSEFNIIDDTGTDGSGSWCGYYGPIEKNSVGYLARYARWLGLNTSTDVIQSGGNYNEIGRNPDRRWCYGNLNIDVGIGDHEEVNDPETEVLDDVRKAASLIAYDAIFAPLQERIIDRSWIHRIGCVNMIHIDRMTNCSDLSNPVFDETDYLSTGAEWMGDANIAAVKAAFDDTASFHIMGMTTGYSAMFSQEDLLHYRDGDSDIESGDDWIPSPGYTYQVDMCGIQSPFALYQPQEHNALFTDEVDGLLKQADDTNNPFIMLHGDIHRTEEHVMNAPASANKYKQQFHYLSCGSVNAYVNQWINPDCWEERANAVVDTPAQYQGLSYRKAPVNAEWLYNPNQQRRPRFGYIRMDVYGSESPKRLVVSQYVSSDATDSATISLFQRNTFYEGQGHNFSVEYIEEVGMSKYRDQFISNPVELDGTELLGVSVSGDASGDPTKDNWSDGGIDAKSISAMANFGAIGSDVYMDQGRFLGLADGVGYGEFKDYSFTVNPSFTPSSDARLYTRPDGSFVSDSLGAIFMANAGLVRINARHLMVCALFAPNVNDTSYDAVCRAQWAMAFRRVV